jgi:hypothetical protein
VHRLLPPWLTSSPSTAAAPGVERPRAALVPRRGQAGGVEARRRASPAARCTRSPTTRTRLWAAGCCLPSTLAICARASPRGGDKPPDHARPAPHVGGGGTTMSTQPTRRHCHRRGGRACALAAAPWRAGDPSRPATGVAQLRDRLDPCRREAAGGKATSSQPTAPLSPPTRTSVGAAPGCYIPTAR